MPAALALCLLTTGPAAATSSVHAAQTALELATVADINAIRTAHHLAPLDFSRGLFTSAALHDEQMVEGGYFGHQNPDGSNFADRLEAHYPPGRAAYYAVGENLFWTQGPVSSALLLVRRWMESTEHRANILNPTWRQVGVSVLSVDSASGVFGSRPITVVTVDFGVRRG